MQSMQKYVTMIRLKQLRFMDIGDYHEVYFSPLSLWWLHSVVSGSMVAQTSKHLILHKYKASI